MPEGLSWSWELDMDELLAALGIPADAGMSADPEDSRQCWMLLPQAALSLPVSWRD